METRLRVVGLFFILAMFVLLVRLFYWQILRGKVLSAQARAQHVSGENIDAPRGDILARDGSWLAASSESWLVFASSEEIDRPIREIANLLAPLLIDEDDEEEDLLGVAMEIEGLLKGNNSLWIPLKKGVNSEIKKKIEELAVNGIHFEKQEARIYPEGSSAAQVMGFVGKDQDGSDRGYFGLEGFYDLTLSGKPGFVERESNPLGVPILSGRAKEITAIGGVSLHTHLDRSIQLLIEKKLAYAIETYGAVAGTIIVMDPKTGGILGMASSPSYDPGKYYEFGDEYFKNPAISDSFEPGSIFKPIVMASALDAGEVEPDTKCDICTEPYKVDKYVIRTWNNEYHPDSTMTEVLLHSDNVGMVFVGQKLGMDRMYDYLSAFGFGRATGIDLQGEVSAPLRKKDEWNIVDLSTASFGQGIAVTPIQMVKAMAIIANNGVEITPQVVDKLEFEGRDDDIDPEIGKRVISKKSVEKIKQMLVEASSHGEAQWTAIKDFKIAGKTGTAQIPVSGHYDEEKTIASFIGFAPADEPKFVMLVTLREPQSSPWAAETAAPLWFSIASDLFPYLGIHPER
ncbi:MAG: Peptidoglycan glycosyltransferase [Candidatus Woesebacteria bacterium GW2011_GWB1_43_14]|uniref:Peptidoglycan glycosyltransferase n=1 Tax=Candidatus Woesebacteria bacterium GW2011_GWB1_43_14 TaxID=1618578 RepID=A0A0G1DH29_9BACT|nr:MAG: Peptidoglycan glycosyltransferase [Candidatus Woesebacteria bacterium GW2011_GWA1_39_11b]KKS78428.1 MAG: Peptidoglycan glycosyltransferase [Candidatus Woesebacteria bacterium GW2011_GWC1_42_9]KKS97155.1 MAG: Peptidoglycan glycosyltransferase [Candidatus Woesebacteria bacterium GW2011_GWB1_43_14]